MKNRNLILTIVFLFALSISSFAHEPHQIRKVMNKQHHQIHKGMKNGKISRAEYHSLIKEQKFIKRAFARAKADGFITKRERKRIIKMQKNASDRIYAFKNNNDYRRRYKRAHSNRYRFDVALYY